MGCQRGSLLCGPGDDLHFIEHVLSEILALFPSRQIHIGGDECPVTRWQDCPQCRRRMQTERLADETALRSYFVRRIQQWLQVRGREIIGWDELLEGELSSEVILMVWRDPAHAYEAIRRGCRVILSPKQYWPRWGGPVNGNAIAPDGSTTYRQRGPDSGPD